MGTVTGSGSFAAGATPTITASAKQGYHFTGWTSTEAGVIADTSAASTTVTMPAKAITVTANFEADTTEPTTGQVLEVVDAESSTNSFWGRYQDSILTGQDYYYAFDYKYDNASAMDSFMVYSELVSTYEWCIRQTGENLTISEQGETPKTLMEGLSANVWHHFVIHDTPTTMGVYIDGQLQNGGEYFTRTKRPNYKYEMLGWNGRVGAAMKGHAYYDNLYLIDGGTKVTYAMPWDNTTIDEIKAGDTNNKWVDVSTRQPFCRSGCGRTVL